MNLTLIGQSQWARDMAKGIAQFGGARTTVVPMDRLRDMYGLLRLRALRHTDVLVRVGFRPGAGTVRGRAFDALLAAATVGARARRAFFWIGTDVDNTLKQASSGASMARFRRLVLNATNVADGFGLRDELRALGVAASVAWMPPRYANRSPELPALPDRFTVLSYLPDARHEFYGSRVLLEAARRLPDVRFRIASGTGSWAIDVPGNVEFLGRVPDIRPLMRDASCLARIVEHDGTSGMVLEALTYGRAVIYSSPFPHTTHVPFGDTEAFEYAVLALMPGGSAAFVSPDAEAATWAQAASDEAECWTTLLEALTGGPGRS